MIYSLSNEFVKISDTSAMSLANASDSISATQISELETFMLDNQPILSKNGAAFTAISQAKIISSTNTKLDIS